MRDPHASQDWEPWTGTIAELADLNDDIEVIDIGCSGFSRAAAEQTRYRIFIRRKAGPR